jgi:hypothetical protein
MLATLAIAMLLNGPVEPRLAVRLSIDQDGRLSASQLQLAIDEVRTIWSDAHVAVTSGRYGEPSLHDEATISLRILLMPSPVTDDGNRVLAWVTPGRNGRSAPLLFISLPAVTETVMGAVGSTGLSGSSRVRAASSPQRSKRAQGAGPSESERRTQIGD